MTLTVSSRPSAGDIDVHIEAHGYVAYAAANVETYLAHRPRGLAVLAVSSGFMVYPAGLHPAIRSPQRQIAAAPTTVLLLRSLDLESCVAETVRRQAARPLAIHRPPACEEAVIRERFRHYRRLRPYVVTTMRPVQAVAQEIVGRLAEATDILTSATVLPTER